MRIRRLGLAALLAVALCQAAAAGGETNAQLLKNPGFEEGTAKQAGLNAIVPKHWARDWANKGPVELIEDAKLAHSGKDCVRISGAAIYQGGIAVEPGMRYRVRMWIKGEGAARQTIVAYTYAWTQKRGRKQIKNVKSDGGGCGFGGKGYNRKVANEWTMVERVYTCPTDGSVEVIAVALHAGPPKGKKGSVLVDDASVRAWDGRPLAVRVATSAIFQDKEKYAQAMAKHAEFKKKRGPALEAIYARAAKLQAAAKNEDTLPLEDREALEAQFEKLLAEYANTRDEVELDLEDL